MAPRMTDAQAKTMFKAGVPYTKDSLECDCGSTVPAENLRRLAELPKLMVAECPSCGRKWGLWNG